MGKVFISAGHGGFEDGFRNPGAIADDTTEAVEMIATRDLVVAALQSRRIEVETPSDRLSFIEEIAWINARGTEQDVAIELRLGSFRNIELRGATVFYIAANSDRKRQAKLLLDRLIDRIPELPSLGIRPDTEAALGRLAFCRDVTPPSLSIELGYLSNPQDRRLLQTRRREYAQGLADGLEMWLKTVSEVDLGSSIPSVSPVPKQDRISRSNVITPPLTRPLTNAALKPARPKKPYPSIDIRLNGQDYAQKGIVASGNAYIPEDLLIFLGVNINLTKQIRRILYQDIVYIQSIGLRDLDISITWDAKTRTVIIRTVFKVCVGPIDLIMSYGLTTEIQLTQFLKQNNPEALQQFADLPRIYREEAAIESVNHDIAFCQMCVETGFLQFGGDVKLEQNNFGGITSKDYPTGVSFVDRRTGIRAQIQHLKAYASTAPLIQPVVDPDFNSIDRGLAPLVGQLTGRWTIDRNYDKKILAIVRRLYEFAGIL